MPFLKRLATYDLEASAFSILFLIVPSNFEIKDWHIKSADGKRDDCEMNTEEGDDGTHISWMIPIVGKDERLEVSFEIKGSGEVDAEAFSFPGQ